MSNNGCLSKSESRPFKWSNFPSFLVKQSIYHLTPADWEGGWKVGKFVKLKFLSFWLPKLEILYVPAWFVYLCNNTVEPLTILIGGFIETTQVPYCASLSCFVKATGGPSRIFKVSKRKKTHLKKEIKLTQINVERIPQCTGGGEVICLAFMRGLNSIDSPFPSVRLSCRTIAGYTIGPARELCLFDESRNSTVLVTHSDLLCFPLGC